MNMSVTNGRVKTLSNHRWLISFSARIADIASTLLSGYICYAIFLNNWNITESYMLGTVVGGLLVSAVIPNLGVYRTWRGRVLSPLLFKLMMGYFIVALVFTSLLYLSGFGEYFSRLWLVSWFILAFMGSLLVRGFTYPVINYFRLTGRNRRQVVLVGDAHSCATAAAHLNAEPTAGFDIAQIYLVSNDVMSELSDMGLNWRTYTADRIHEIETDEVWICLPLSRGNQVKEIISSLGLTAANVRYMPDMRDFRLINHDICNVANLYLLNMSCSPISGSSRWIKAIEDRLISALILLAISPVMLLLAVGVKLSSPGPIFYRQERVSWNGKPFNMLKFRSMPVNSEAHGVQWGGAKNKTNTKFGSFIRSTSLDELPQFINVLLGDMSIVGPRPERTIFVDQFKHEIPGYMQKHLMKAGITGWAQINGWRGDTNLEKRVECDLWYIEQWSVMLDLKIIFLTIFKGFINKNAC